MIKEIPDIERFKEENVRMVFFNQTDFTAFLTYLSPVLQDMVLFAYHTGWRKGQVLALQWKDIDDNVIRLTGKTVKTKQVQVLSLAGDLGEIIKRRRRVQNGPWVFHRGGRQVRDFREAWKNALEKAGLSDYHFHDFRRTATRNMALAGVPERHIMQVTGAQNDRDAPTVQYHRGAGHTSFTDPDPGIFATGTIQSQGKGYGRKYKRECCS